MMTQRFIDPWVPKDVGPFRVGDRVRVPFGGGTIEATIVEDHRNLGRGGVRIYGVCFRVDELTEEVYTERDANQITLVARAENDKKNGARK
jgi:hypothetical protein